MYIFLYVFPMYLDYFYRVGIWLTENLEVKILELFFSTCDTDTLRDLIIVTVSSNHHLFNPKMHTLSDLVGCQWSYKA